MHLPMYHLNKDYFLAYLKNLGLIDFYGSNKDDWKLTNLGKAYCFLIFFGYMSISYVKSEFYKNLKKEGKI